jgi:colanic acid/amylovoran biosynthesis glycosyltransferase
MSYPGKTVVLHSVRQWLTPTKTWIYEQLRWLPPHIEAHVSCESTEHLDQFPFARLHVLERATTVERSLDRLGRKARVPSLRATTRLCRQLSASVFHSHFGQEAWRERQMAKVAGLPQVATFYGYDVTRVPQESAEWRRRYLELFATVALVLCEGPHMREELLRLGAPAAKVRVQHLGANLEQLPFTPHTWTRGTPVRILMAASFREKKGLPFALRAVAEVARTRPELDLRVTIVGDAGSDLASQHEKALILEAVGQLPPGKVDLLGFRAHADLIALAERHDIFMSPSVRAADGDTEGGAPVALIELAATGLPVISTTHCDIPNVLRGKAAALLAPERDVGALAERLRWVLDHTQDTLEISHFVRGEIEERFDAQRQAVRLAQIYVELSRLQRRPHAGLLAFGAAEAVAQRLRKRFHSPPS